MLKSLGASLYAEYLFIRGLCRVRLPKRVADRLAVFRLEKRKGKHHQKRGAVERGLEPSLSTFQKGNEGGVMARSIMEPRGVCECYNCGDTRNLEEHHVFFGKKQKKKSEHYGLKVHLCPGCHRHNKTGVHGGNIELDKRLKEEAERIFEEKYSRELFREEFGRYYTEETNDEAKGQQENGFIRLEETC